MTGGFRRVSIMKPNHCWVLLHVSMLVGLLLTSSADSGNSTCEIEIKVRRNTVYDAKVGQELTINCTVAFCNNSPPTVSWLKLESPAAPVDVSSSSHIKTDWTQQSPIEGMSYLIFMNIQRNDTGQYRCQSGGSISHTINVTVYDKEMTTAATNNNTSATSSTPATNDMLMYVYVAAGIVAFVIMVIIISFISMQGCKEKSKQETQTDNQYMEIPMMDQPSSQASPRGSPSAPLPRRSTRRKPQDELPSELTPNNQVVYGKVREDRQRQRPRQRNEGGEEGGSVVYAALNHQLPPRAAARQPRPQEDFSEYAAIRVP